MTTRRGFITGLGALFIAAPAIVRASSIMPVKTISWNPTLTWDDYSERILRLMIDKLASEVADQVMLGGYEPPFFHLTYDKERRTIVSKRIEARDVFISP